jgi:ribosomal protein S18 acetylase RimI-like enzyme
MLVQEPLTDANLDDVVAFFHAANPFAQLTWGWDSGRFMDWRWGGNTRHLAEEPDWFSRHCTVVRDDDGIRAVLVDEDGNGEMCIITMGEDPESVSFVLDHLDDDQTAKASFEVAIVDGWLADLFSARGFVEEGHTGHEWEYDLSNVPEPVVPDGFGLASLADGLPDAHRGIADCLRAAFETDRDVEAALRSIEGNPMFDPALSIMAISPDGRVAAYCRGSVNADNGIASIDPVATHPDFVRLGLAKAVVRECFRRQAARGGRSSFIGSAPEPAPSTYLYRSLGPMRWSDNSSWSRPKEQTETPGHPSGFGDAPTR